MFKHFKRIPLAFLLPILLVACSGTPLQSKRMDLAENHIYMAERALSSNPSRQAVYFADENIGTANAYLATVNDNKRFLTKNELGRFGKLKQRASVLLKRIK